VLFCRRDPSTPPLGPMLAFGLLLGAGDVRGATGHWWGDYWTLAFAGIAALGVLGPLAWWLSARYRSVRVRFVRDFGPNRDPLKFGEVLVGVPMRVRVEIKCRRAVAFREIQVRVLGDSRRWRVRAGKWRPPSGVSIVSVEDVTLSALGWDDYDDPDLPWRLLRSRVREPLINGSAFSRPTRSVELAIPSS